MKSTSLLVEEKRSTKLFLWLFYIVFFIYDMFYYNLFPAFPWLPADSANLVWYDFNYIKYMLFIALIPMCIYLMKTNKVGHVKYIVFFSYLSINLVADILYYKDSTISYSSGSLVELVIILFSPIFVNKRFAYCVSIGLILKYVLIGLIIQDLVVLFPVIVNILLSFIAFLLLHRFLNYIRALKNSHYEQLEGIVKGIIATLEMKDPYTRGHSERVAAYAIEMAKATGKFKSSELLHFYYACLLHDIGKVNIPDSILTKSGKLTDEEYEFIKTHPVVGAKAVQHVEGIADNIGVIYHHHERWDGKGYPDGISGEHIPLLARITAIADSFDAMTSSRSYRPALPHTEAYRRILAGKGSQFDPQLVDLFKEIYPKWVKISKKYSKEMNQKGGEKRENPEA